jgi:hypothetical protein
MRSPWFRVALFGAICVMCAVTAVGYLAMSSRSGDRSIDATTAGAAGSTLTDFVATPHLLFRDTSGGGEHGRVAVSALDDPNGPRAMTSLRCDRVHMAAGSGLCLRAELGIFPRYEAMVFDDAFQVRHRFDIAGQPSRTQVSPDGTRAAYTVFVTGHSYADGGFSTRTAIVDVATGDELAELEQFTVRRDGEVFDEEDFNFWGVTFTDDADRFYATLGTGEEVLLVEGDLTTRELKVITDDVECPSLSPDGTRVAYKERHVDAFGLVSWRLAVLDLATTERVTLAETRDIDDQAEWVDDRTVMYGLDDPSSFSPETEVWTVPADGGGEPSLLAEAAWSPVIVG